MSKIYVSIFHSTVVTRTQCNTYFWTLLFLKLVGRKFRQKLRNLSQQCNEDDLQVSYTTTVLDVLCSYFVINLFHNFQIKCKIYNHTDKCSQQTVAVSGFDSTLINLKSNERTYLNCRPCLSNIFQHTQ